METQEVTKNQLSDLVKDTLNNLGLQEIKDQLTELAAKGEAWESKLSTVEEKVTEPKEREKGADIGRFMRALAAGKGDARRAAEYARTAWKDERIAKALESGDEAAGGFLIKDAEDAGLIELLRPASVVRSLNPITVPAGIRFDSVGCQEVRFHGADFERPVTASFAISRHVGA